jgi:hypothetical protein
LKVQNKLEAFANLVFSRSIFDQLWALQRTETKSRCPRQQTGAPQLHNLFHGASTSATDAEKAAADVAVCGPSCAGGRAAFNARAR